MATNYVQEGDVIDWTNSGTAVVSGAVIVMGSNGDADLGVALVDIANSATGSVAREGVFTVPKVSAAVIASGERVNWDVSAAAFDDNAAVAAAGDVTEGAVAIESAGAGVLTIKVALNPGKGIIT